MTDLLPPQDATSPRPFDAERRLRHGARLQGAWTFATPEDEQACLAQVAGVDEADLIAALKDDPKAQAQELALQALEAASPEQARALASRALELDRACLDARLVAAQTGSPQPREQVEALRALVKEADAEVDPFLQRTWAGRYHQALRLRPHLRIRKALAEVLVPAGRKRQAIQVLEELLKLDLRDPLGGRFLLAQLFVATAQRKDLLALAARFSEDGSLPMAWIQLLAKVLLGEEPAAREHLSRLSRRNPHVGPLLVGKARKPRHPSPNPEAGSPDEAWAVLSVILPAWTSDRAAIFWLAQHA